MSGESRNLRPCATTCKASFRCELGGNDPLDPGGQGWQIHGVPEHNPLPRPRGGESRATCFFQQVVADDFWDSTPGRRAADDGSSLRLCAGRDPRHSRPAAGEPRGDRRASAEWLSVTPRTDPADSRRGADAARLGQPRPGGAGVLRARGDARDRAAGRAGAAAGRHAHQPADQWPQPGPVLAQHRLRAHRGRRAARGAAARRRTARLHAVVARWLEAGFHQHSEQWDRAVGGGRA